MIALKLLLCADSLLRDAESNNISAITIFEELTPIGLPLFLPRISVLSVFERGEDDQVDTSYILNVKLDTETLFSQEIPLNFQGKFRSRSKMVLGGLPIPRPGLLNIEIIKDSNILGVYTIVINQPAAPSVVSSSS